MCLYVHVLYMHMCVHILADTSTCAWGQQFIARIFLYPSLPYFLWQSLSPNLEFTVLPRLIHQQDPGICLCLTPSPGLRVAGHHIWLLQGYWGSTLRCVYFCHKHFLYPRNHLCSPPTAPLQLLSLCFPLVFSVLQGTFWDGPSSF